MQEKLLSQSWTQKKESSWGNFVVRRRSEGNGSFDDEALGGGAVARRRAAWHTVVMRRRAVVWRTATTLLNAAAASESPPFLYQKHCTVGQNIEVTVQQCKAKQMIQSLHDSIMKLLAYIWWENDTLVLVVSLWYCLKISTNIVYHFFQYWMGF